MKTYLDQASHRLHFEEPPVSRRIGQEIEEADTNTNSKAAPRNRARQELTEARVEALRLLSTKLGRGASTAEVCEAWTVAGVGTGAEVKSAATMSILDTMARNRVVHRAGNMPGRGRTPTTLWLAGPEPDGEGDL